MGNPAPEDEAELGETAKAIKGYGSKRWMYQIFAAVAGEAYGI